MKMKQRPPVLASTPEQKALLRGWQKYRGSIVLVIGDRIFSTKRANRIPQLLAQIEKEHHRRPLITYVPREGALVLFL